MKVKGLADKICMLNPNSVSCDAGEFDKLKEGKIVELKKEDAQQLISMGMVTPVKESKVKEKNNG